MARATADAGYYTRTTHGAYLIVRGHTAEMTDNIGWEPQIEDFDATRTEAQARRVLKAMALAIGFARPMHWKEEGTLTYLLAHDTTLTAVEEGEE